MNFAKTSASLLGRTMTLTLFCRVYLYSIVFTIRLVIYNITASHCTIINKIQIQAECKSKHVLSSFIIPFVINIYFIYSKTLCISFNLAEAFVNKSTGAP